jgi:hypothetical protein
VGLTHIDIEGTPTTIGKYAFRNTRSLTSITIPESVTRVDEYSFYGSISLKTLRIPESVLKIGETAFGGMTSLESLTIPFIGSSRDSYKNKNIGYLFGKKAFERSYKANGYYIPRSLEEIIITDEKSIGEYAFYDLEYVVNISINDNITSIGKFAFYNTKRIKTIDIPKSVLKIGESAFGGMTSLESLTIPFIGGSRDSEGKMSHFGYIFGKNKNESYESNGYYIPKTLYNVTVTDIFSVGKLAFYNVSGVKYIFIPDTVVTIEEGAFFGTSELLSFVIPENVVSIGSYAFSGAEKIKLLSIPNSVVSVGESAFSRMSMLESIFIPKSVSDLGAFIFYESLNAVIFIEANEKQSNWDGNWNFSNNKVNWQENRR